MAPTGREVGLLGIDLYLDNLFLWCLLKRGVVGLGALVSMGFQHATKGKRAGAVGDIVDQWNMVRPTVSCTSSRGLTVCNRASSIAGR